MEVLQLFTQTKPGPCLFLLGPTNDDAVWSSAALPAVECLFSGPFPAIWVLTYLPQPSPPLSADPLELGTQESGGPFHSLPPPPVGPLQVIIKYPWVESFMREYTGKAR